MYNVEELDLLVTNALDIEKNHQEIMNYNFVHHINLRGRNDYYRRIEAFTLGYEEYGEQDRTTGNLGVLESQERLSRFYDIAYMLGIEDLVTEKLMAMDTELELIPIRESVNILSERKGITLRSQSTEDIDNNCLSILMNGVFNSKEILSHILLYLLETLGNKTVPKEMVDSLIPKKYLIDVSIDNYSGRTMLSVDLGSIIYKLSTNFGIYVDLRKYLTVSREYISISSGSLYLRITVL